MTISSQLVDQKMIVTGCKDGQICVWDIVDGAKIVPRSMLFGHTGPVLCLASASPSGDGSLLVSSSEAGEMSLWDLTDGRCLENNKLPYVHTHMQSHMLSGGETSYLFCNGYYADVVVLDTMTLTVAFELVSRISSDWISAMHVIRTPTRNDDVVVAISACGMAKVWTLSPENYKSSSPLYEGESMTLKCLNALCLACCAYNQRTILVVTAKCWHIYDAYDFALLCSTDNRPGERWMGGDFISADRPNETYDPIIRVLTQHLSPEPSKIYKTFRFQILVQNSGECVADFLAKLRKITDRCGFGEALERNFRDRFVIRLREKGVQWLLLAKPHSLTLKDVLDTAPGCRVSISNASRLLRSSDTPVTMVATGVNVLEQRKHHGNQKASRPLGKKLSCILCGKKSHSPPECPRKNITCFKRNKRGHLASQCFGNKTPGHKGKFQLNMVVEEEPESFYLSTVQSPKDMRNTAYTTTLNWGVVELQI
ncbi:hypothetical protein MRX96_014597 [Rhipicephalus microplus]